MLVFIINLGLARKFSLVLLHNFVAGQRGSTGRCTHLPNSIFSTSGSLRLSPSLPTPYKRGGCPYWHLPRRCPCGILVLRVPFLWATRAHDTWPTLADYFGARGALDSVRIFPQPRSQPVNRLLHPSKRFLPSFDTNNKPTSILVNLTCPLTNITLTPGSLGLESREFEGGGFGVD